MKKNFASPGMPAVTSLRLAAIGLAFLAHSSVFAQVPYTSPLTKVDASSNTNADGAWVQAPSAYSQSTMIQATATAVRGTSGPGLNTVIRVDITNPGAGYLVPPTVTIGAPPGGGGVQATATATLTADGRISAINVNTAGSGYTSGTISLTISAPVAGGVGSTIRFNNDITANRILTLGGNRTVGQMIIGDLGSTQTYTLAAGTNGILTFDNEARAGSAFINKFQGGTDEISAPIVLNDQLNIRVTTSRLTLSNTITGNGNTLTSYGNGVLYITGNNSASDYDLHLWNKGAANANAQVMLAATVGNAVGGDVTVGNASRGTSGHAVLQLLQGRSNLDQIKDDATVTFDSIAGSGRNNYFKLMGGNETVGRILDLGSLAVIENRESETVNTSAKLTLAGNLDSYVSGFIRDNSGNNQQQADSDGSAGDNSLAVRKQGSGRLTLQGGNIIFTGGLEIDSGTVVLRQTTNFRSDIENAGTLILDNTGTWNFTKTFADPDGAGPLRAPPTDTLQITGSGNVEKTNNGILNLNSGQDIGGSFTVRNGTLNLAGSASGNRIGGGLIVTGDSGLNRNVNLLGNNTIEGGINAVGRFNNTGSAITVNGTVFSRGDQVAGVSQDGISTITGDIKLNYMDLRLESGFTINKTVSGSSGSTITISDSSAIIVGMRVSGTGVAANTVVTAFDPQTRVATLNNSTTAAAGGLVTFSYASNNDGVIQGNPSSLTIIGRPNAIGTTVIPGKLVLNNSQYSNNSNRFPDSTPIALKGGGIEFVNDASTNNFSETLGALTIAEGQAQIISYQTAAGRSSTLTFNSLTRNSGATVEFAGRDLTGGAITTVTDTLGTTDRNRIKITGGVTLDDGIIGGWAWANNEFVKYSESTGVTRLLSSDYSTGIPSTWRSTQNVKTGITANPATISNRTAVNSLNIQPDTSLGAAGRTLTLGALLSIESGGLLSNHGSHTINGNATSYLTVGTASNTPAELITIVGTTAGSASANALTLNTAPIRDFTLSLTSSVTMAAASTTMNVPTNTATVLVVGMTVSHPNLPPGTVVTAVDKTSSGATTITLSNAPISGGISTSGTNPPPVVFTGGSVGLTKSGPGTLILPSQGAQNTYSGPTIINNGILRFRANSNFGTAPSSFSANHLQINGGTLQFGQDAFRGSVGQREPNTVYTISDANRGITIAEAGGRIEVGYSTPLPTLVNGAPSENVTPVIDAIITSPINALGVLELAVRANNQVQEYNTLTLGDANSENKYLGGIKTEGTFDGIITINGQNEINGLFLEGGRMTLPHSNDFDGDIRVVGGSILTLNGSNTYKGGSNFTETVTIGSATVILGNNSALGTGGIRVNLQAGGQLRLSGTNQTIRNLTSVSSASIVNGSNSTDSNLTINLDVNEIYSGTFSNEGSGTLNVIKAGPGRLSLTNSLSTFSGNVEISEGVLDIASINFAGGESALGTGVTGKASEILIDGGALSFSPRSQQFTDRSFTMGAGENAATLVANGLNQAARVILGSDFVFMPGTPREERFTSQPILYEGSGPRTLTLSGVNTGDNELQLQLADSSPSDPTSLLKIGPGTWALGKAGLYSGQVTVQEGVLAILANDTLGTVAQPTTFNPSTDRFIGNLPDGVEVSFPLFIKNSDEFGDLRTLPTGIVTNKVYYVVNSVKKTVNDPATFQVSATRGGLPVDGQSTGNNVVYVPNIQSIASTVPDFTQNTFTGNLPDGTAVVFGVQIPIRGQGSLPQVNGSLPSGIKSFETYYVRDATGTHFRVSREPEDGAVVALDDNGQGNIYYTAALVANPSSGINIIGGRLELRNVDYMTQETATFQGGALSLPANTQARWAGNFDIQANASFTVGSNSELILDGNLLGNRSITQLGEGTIRLRGEAIAPTLPNPPAVSSGPNEMDNFRRTYTLQAGTLILDYSRNNNSKLVDTASLTLGGGRRGGVLRLQEGSHEEIVNNLSLSTGASAIYRDSGSSTIRLNTITRGEGATLYFDLARIASVDNLNINNILGGWAIVRDALVQASWVLPGTVSRNFSVIEESDTIIIKQAAGPAGLHYMSNGTPVVLSTIGTLPAPLVAGQIYYVTNAGRRTFKLSTVPFGSPIDITNTGSTGISDHTVQTAGPIKRQGLSTLVFNVNSDNYPGSSGNDIIRIEIEYNGGSNGLITSEIVVPPQISPATPVIYKVITTALFNSANDLVDFISGDPKAAPYFSVSAAEDDSAPDTGSYGPTLLQGGDDDNGSTQLGWARNSTNSLDGLVQPLTTYVRDWGFNANTNVENSDEISDGSTTYTLRFATNTPITLDLLRNSSNPRGHTLQTGSILVSPTVGANDSILSGSGTLTTANDGNLRNFIINQFNTLGDLVISVPLVDRKPIERTGRLTSGNRRILSGLSRTSDLVVGATVAFTSPLPVSGPTTNQPTRFILTTTPSVTYTDTATIVEIYPDGHTVLLDRESNGGDNRYSMNFTVGGSTFPRMASHQSATTQNRILGITRIENGQPVVSSSDIYVGMPISGPGIPAGATVDFIPNDADIRINTNHFFVDIQSELTLTPSVGLEKLGGGTLILNGDNTYTGVTFLADGVLRAQKLTDGGIAGSLGKSSRSADNLNFNGGTLQYVGENTSTNRDFRVTDYAQISVGHEKATTIMSGSIAASGTLNAADRLEKTGTGILEMRGGSNLNEIKISEGTLRIQTVDLNAAPGTFSPSNFGQNGLASVRLSGGVLEVRGAQEGNISQTFGGALYVEEGSSEVRSVSVQGYDPNNLNAGSLARTTTINLMGGEETASVVRSSGGTVRFIENPLAGAGAANIVLNTFAFDRAQVLPWAVYQDTTNVANPGINNFAAVSLATGALVSADALFLYDLGSFFSNAANWGTVEPGSTIDASEGGRSEVVMTSGVTAKLGSFELSVGENQLTNFNLLRVGMSVTGPGVDAATEIAELDEENLKIVLDKAAIANGNTIQGSYVFSQARTFFGVIQEDEVNGIGPDREVNTIRYFSAEDSTITINSGSTLRLTAGAILVGGNVRDGAKSIVGQGNITGVTAAGEGTDLIVHNYNPVTPFTIGANVIDNVIQLQIDNQTGTSVIEGSAVMSVSTSLIDLFNRLHVGMEVTGEGIAPGTFIAALNSFLTEITLSKPAISTTSTAIHSFRSVTSFVQTGIGTTILSGNNVYTGKTFAHGGVLRLESANAVPGGIGSTAPLATSSHIVLKDGVLGLGVSDFTRGLGTADNQIEFKGSGGFAAYNADRIVNFGGLAQPKSLRFGNDGFVPDGSSLILGAVDASHKLTLVNSIDLGSFSQAVRVNNGPAEIEGELSGVLSGQGRLIKFGLGALRLNAENTHEGGIEVAEGKLVVANVTNALGSSSGTLAVGVSSTNTSKNAALEVKFEGGTFDNNIKIGGTNSRSSDWVTRTNIGANSSSHASSAVINGNPAIAYYDSANGDLKFVRATDPRGSSWFAPVTLAEVGDVGQYPSLSVINGFPAVSYYDVTNGTLCYVQSTDSSGVFWRSPVIADSSPVSAVAVQSDGKVIVGGTFTEFDGVSKTRIARLTAAGALDGTFSTNASVSKTGSASAEIRAIVVQSDDKIIIAGDFTSVNGVERNYIARLNSDGTLDTGYNPDADNTIRKLLLQQDGSLLVAGAFTNIGGSNRNRLARLNSSGLADSFNPNVSGEVRAIALQTNGSVVLGGNFTEVNGTTRNRIARVDSTGLLDASFDPNANSEVRGIVVAADGKIYIGGLFANLTGTGLTTTITRNRLARLNTNGTVDTSYGVEVDAEIRDMRLLSDGKIALLGIFSKVGETQVNFLARLDADGDMDTTFLPQPNYEVRDIVEQTDQKLIVGGLFSNVGGATQHWVGRLNTDGSVDAAFSREVDDRGQYSSLVSVGGFPAIAYYDAINGDLRYIRGSDVNGSGWGSSIILDATGNVGMGTSMKVVNIGGDILTKNTSNNTITVGGIANNGTPAVAYYDVTNGDLKYILSNDALGNDWSSSIVIQGTGNVGSHVSLELVDGFPAVAYYDSTDGNLLYRRSRNTAGLVHNVRDTNGAVTTISINALVYSRNELTSPRAAVWGDNAPANSNAEGDAILLDSTGDVGQFPSLTVVNGQPTTTDGTPAVAYYDATNGNLKYVRANNALGLPTGNIGDPAAWGTAVTLQSAGDVGRNATLMMTDGVPGIAYRDATAQNMKFIHLSDAFGYSKLSFADETTLNGTIELEGTVFFDPAAGQLVTLNGALTGAGGFRLISEGSLLLNGTGSNYGSSFGPEDQAPSVIRTGTLLVGNSSALGMGRVDLGDAFPKGSQAIVTVKIATTLKSLTDAAGRFDPNHNGLFGNTTGPGAFVEIQDTIDGVELTAIDAANGTLVLVKDEVETSRNGIYRVIFGAGAQPDRTINLVRAVSMDELAEFAYGRQVRVQEGTHAGQAFFLASEVTDMNVSPVEWMRDAPDANLALLANNSGVSLANAIDVNSRLGAGSITLGAASTVTTGTVNFNGAITLRDQTGAGGTQQLNLTSNIATGFGVNVAGVISQQSGTLGLVKTGTGVVTLRGNNTFQGGVTVNQGTLLVMNTVGSGTGIGNVTVNAGAVLGGTGTISGSVSLIGTGSDLGTRATLRIGDPTLSTAAEEKLTIGGALTVGPNSVVEFNMGVNNYSKLAASTLTITETGRLIVSFTNELLQQLQVDDDFTIMDVGTVNFTAGGTIVLSEYLKLPGQFIWDTTQFLTNGTIRVAGQTQAVQVVSVTPTSSTVNPGVNLNLIATVSGSADFVYQWKKSVGGAAYENVGAAIRSSSTTNTLALTSITEADQASYIVVVTNGEGSFSDESDPVTVDVNDPPVIVTAPEPVTINPGLDAVFEVTVSGPSPYTFVWRRGTQTIANGSGGGRFVITNPTSQTSRLTITGVTQADESANYNVIVGNAAGDAPATAAVALVVNDPVVITTPPSSIIVSDGDPAVFTVQHTGTAPFEYRWQRDTGSGFQDAPNNSSQTFTIPAVTLAEMSDPNNPRAVRVIISNNVGEPVTSATATYTVNDGVPSFLENPKSATILAGTTLELSVKVGGSQDGRSVVWKRNKAVIKQGNINNRGVISNISVSETLDGTALVSTLTITNITTALAGDFTCDAVNAKGKNSSTVGTGRIAVVSNPVPATIVAAQETKTAVLTVTVGVPKGIVVGYQWKKKVGDDLTDIPLNTEGLPLTTLKTLSFKGLTTDQTGTYVCEVTGPGIDPENKVVGATHELKVFNDVPEVLAEPFPAAMVGSPFSYQIQVNDDPTKAPSKFAAKGLPAGLKLDTKTGRIQGVPTKAGPATVTITASNTKASAPVILSLEVQPVPSGAVGVFAGWLPRHEMNSGVGGRFDMVTNDKGTYSGRITLGTTAYAFKGALVLEPESNDENAPPPALPTATVTILRKGKPVPAPLTLTFSIDPETNLLADASVTTVVAPAVDPVTMNFTGWRNIWLAKVTPPPAADYAAYYTMALMPPATGTADEMPQGDGYASFTVAANGTFKVTGRTADDQPFTSAQFVGPTGQVVLFQTLYKTTIRGSLLGQFNINKGSLQADPTDNRIDLTPGVQLTWKCEPNTTRRYPSGFGPLAMTVTGGAYVDPTPTAGLILGLTTGGSDNATLTFSLEGLGVDIGDPSLPSATPGQPNNGNYLSIGAGNIINLPSLRAMGTTLKVAPKTGLFSGAFKTFENDATFGDSKGQVVRPGKFLGILVRTNLGQRGMGYFVLPKRPSQPGQTLKNTLEISNQVFLAPR